MPENQNPDNHVEQTNSYQYNPNRPQNDPNDHSNTQKVVDTVGKGAAEYLAPGVGGMAYDAAKNAPVVGDAIDRATSDIAKRADQVPGMQNLSKKLNDTKALDAANHALNLGGKNVLGHKPRSGNQGQSSNESDNVAPVQNIRKNNFFNSMMLQDDLEEPQPDNDLENTNTDNENTNASPLPNEDTIDDNQEIETDQQNQEQDGGRGTFSQVIWKKYKWPILLMGSGVFLFFLLLFVILGGGSYQTDSDLNSYLTSCSAFPMKETTLSKDEFVELAYTYLTEHYTSESALTFAENLDVAYDVAVSYGINPELVVVRAVLEGFSPGNSNNNYWGYGCYNGAPASECLSYDTFADGVAAYAQNVSQYDTIVDMMSRYAYIGAHWYNPGGSGLGGCYYYSHINEYMSDARAATVANVCNSTVSCTQQDTSNCVATTDEDQEAYVLWQVERMTSVRQSIFGLNPDACENDFSVTSDGLTDILTTSLGQALNEQGVSVEEYNEYILGQILDAGVGTREAAVAAAKALVWTLYDGYGIRLPYMFGGQHSPAGYPAYLANTNINLNRWSYSFYGIDPYWGSSITTTYHNTVSYDRYGPDCSGFVSWILHNAGFDNSHVTDAAHQGALGEQYSIINDEGYIGQPGDLLTTSDHARFILGVDLENQVYYTVHAKGGSSGVVINTLPFYPTSAALQEYQITDMTEWYRDHALYTEENEEEFTNAYRAGYILE